MKTFCVVNMDIVGSRKVKDRNRLQVNLNSYIDQINQEFASILTVPITITLGDEWQLITDKPYESYNLVHQFQQLLWKDGLDLYAGIGIGELGTSIFNDIRNMDGPCFHNARDAINIAKGADKLKARYSINKLNKIFLLTHPIFSEDFNLSFFDFYYLPKNIDSELSMQETAASIDNDPNEDNNKDFFNKLLMERTINLIIENNEILKGKMTDKQREVYVEYKRLGSYRKVVDIAKDAKKDSISGISQKLNSASYFTIQRNHNVVSSLLKLFCEGSATS